MTPQSPAPVAAKTFSVGDYAVRLEDHPLVKAGEVHQIVEMFRGGYLGFAKPIGGEWNPKGWRKCDAEGWMPWSGGGNPVPGQMVDWKARNGASESCSSDELHGWNHPHESGSRYDIIAFRLSRPASEQPVEAIGAGRDLLLPCPFCGGEAEVVEIEEGENKGGSCVCCTRCQASSNVEFGFKENFRSNWNRRAALSPASPARTPMGEPAAWRIGDDGAVYAKLKAARNHVDGWRLQGAECSDPQPLYDRQALAASSPSPAQGGMVAPPSVQPVEGK